MQNNVALVAVVVGVAFLLGAVVMMGVGGFSLPVAAIPILFTIVILGVLVGTIVVMQRRPRGRGPAHGELAEELGLRYRQAVDGPFHHRFGPLPSIGRAGAVSHVHDGTYDGRMMWAFQHTTMIHTGQFSVPVVRSVVAAEAPAWPTLTIRPRSASRRLLGSLSGDPGILLENEVFNARFHVACEDESFAIVLLTPQVQEFLLEDVRVVWRINPGTVAMIRSKRLATRTVEDGLRRISQLMAIVPDELDAW